jgi:hypothetical protein
MGIDVAFFIKNHIHNIAEFISLVIAVIYYPYLKKSFMKWFLPFLGFIFFGELITAYIPVNNPTKSTIGIYYVITVAELCFYGYVFYHLCSKRILKRAIPFIIFTCIVENIISFIIYGIEPNHFCVSLTISGLFLTIVAVSNIYFLFANDINRAIVKEPGFWIAIGVSLFFSATSIVFSLHSIILKNNLTFFGVRLYHIVPGICSIILYLCISIAIILCKKKTKISSQPY